MKSIRSTKSLWPSEERHRIRNLQEQVELLKKSNLNILVPPAEPNHNLAIIQKLRAQIHSLQQENKSLSFKLHNNELQLEQACSQYEARITALNEKNRKIATEMEKVSQQNASLSNINQNLQNGINEENIKRRKAEEGLIQANVEIKFLKQDLKTMTETSHRNLTRSEYLQKCINKVISCPKIYKSDQQSITAIDSTELDSLKRRIKQLEDKLDAFGRRERIEAISLGVPKTNIGQEIVRLKKNIDNQLGLKTSSSTTNSFLAAFKQTDEKFRELLSQCRQPCLTEPQKTIQ